MGIEDSTTGDLYIEMNVLPHDFFKRNGDDIVLELSITADQVRQCAEIEVPTIEGKVKILRLPQWTTEGTIFRLPGLGVHDIYSGNTGDLLVKVHIN